MHFVFYILGFVLVACPTIGKQLGPNLGPIGEQFGANQAFSFGTNWETASPKIGGQLGGHFPGWGAVNLTNRQVQKSTSEPPRFGSALGLLHLL